MFPARLGLVALLGLVGLTAWLVTDPGPASPGLERGRGRIELEDGTVATATAAAPALAVRSAHRQAEPVLRSQVSTRPPGSRAEQARLPDGLSLHGLVLDDRGVPWSSFRVRASRLDSLPRTTVERGFEPQDGWFQLDGLVAGDWELVARSAEGLDSDPVSIAWPGSSTPRLIVPRAGAVRGLVLTADGTIAAGARVWCDDHGAGDSHETRADEDGAFHLTGLAPGVVALLARAPGLAPGPAVVLDLLPGEERSDVVLAMRRGSRVVGEVLDASGGPERGARVSALLPRTSVETDEQGRFELDGLAAGRQELRATTSTGLELRRTVELDEGATERVRLAVPGDPSVRLHGVVTAEALGAVEGRVRAERVDDEGLALACVAELELGTYELLVPGPGEYELAVALQAGGADEIGWRNRIDVPAVDEVEHDLVVPLGRITGRVIDQVGVPLPGVGVETTPERHGREHGSTRVITTAGGHFTLTVAPGLHTVTAGARLGLSPGPRDDGTHTQVRVEGVRVVAGETLELADLVLKSGGTLEGAARRADGTPVIAATLWSHGSGRTDLLGRIENGAFRLEGLAPGTLYLGAAGGGEATPVPVAVSIEAGATARVELQLAPATRVHVRARDAAGALVGCDLEAFDVRGAPVALLRGTTGEAWLGPLPPGDYLVRARRDGRALERPFTVNGEPELELGLTLD
jgi:hypothetical protein